MSGAEDSNCWKQQQILLFNRHLDYLRSNSPYYQRKFAEHGLVDFKLTEIAQLTQLPLTSKGDLAEHNFEFRAVSEPQVVDVCMTSGTTGDPVTLWQSEKDLQRLAANEAAAFSHAGIGSSDRVLITAALDRTFMAGLAYFLGLRSLGATVIRGGSGQLAYSAELIRLQQPNVIVGVPSFLLALARHLAAKGIVPAACGIEKLVCIGEPVRAQDLGLSALGQQLQESWNAQVLGTYASTEMATAFCDCSAACGGHLLSDLILLEIVDEAGHQLPAGVAGEVVVTPMGVEGTPLLRYRTGDIAVLHADPCQCGNPRPRLGPILGRKGQMLKFKGTTLFPGAIAHALQTLPQIKGHYIEVFAEHELSDRIRVVVGGETSSLCEADVAAAIAAKTRVKPEVLIRTPQEIMEMTLRSDQRKPVTFFDYR